MTRIGILPALAAAAMLCCSGCFAGRSSPVMLTREPSIERALDILRTLPDAAPLIRFLRSNPARFSYYGDQGPCVRFSLKTGEIFLPRDIKGHDALTAAVLARAVYIYRLSVTSGLEEIVSEEEEIAALFQARIALSLGLQEEDFRKKKAAEPFRAELCAYLMEGPAAAMLSARAAALSSRPECRRPLDTMRDRRAWLDEVLSVIDDSAAFFRLVKERDLEKVRKGTLTRNEAAKNEAELRALPTYELYRQQRRLYEAQTRTFRTLERLYRASIRNDKSWRELNGRLIGAARTHFSACAAPARTSP